MITLGKQDVEDIIQRVNRKLPQASETNKREFKADYISQYGGWLIYYYNDVNRATAPAGYARISHKEAYRFFEGIEFSLDRLTGQ